MIQITVYYPKGSYFSDEILKRQNHELILSQGIRYARSPEYDLRFAPPVAFVEEPSRNATIDASGISEVMCPQLRETGAVVGQEDCLTLNIYVPEQVYNDPAWLASVMVYIHGGGFVQGSNRYGKWILEMLYFQKLRYSKF